MSSNFNLPISKLQEKRFDINEIKEKYFTDDPFDVEDNLMYFPIALLSNSNYVSRKVNLRNLLRTYTFSQQFILDLYDVLLMNDLSYDLYYGDVRLDVIDGKITIPKSNVDDFYTKSEIDQLISNLDRNINNINTNLNEIIQLRYSYKIQFYYTNNRYTLLINNTIVNDMITETISDSGEIITKVTLIHPLNLNLLNNQMPNVTILENKQILEGGGSFNNCATNYIQDTFVDILIRKESKILNNQLITTLVFNNTRCFMGKLLIN